MSLKEQSIDLTDIERFQKQGIRSDAQTLLGKVIDEENPGIWTRSEIPRKLAAVGLSNRDGVTKHGFAINIDLPLTGFTAIVPCGLTLPVSTMAIETGEKIPIGEVKEKITQILKEELYVILAKHSGKTVEQIEENADRDYWMKADQAKDYGLIDEVLEKK